MGVRFVTTRPIGNLSLGRQKTGQKSDEKDKNIKLIFLPVSVKYEGPGKIFEGSRDKNLLITLTHTSGFLLTTKEPKVSISFQSTFEAVSTNQSLEEFQNVNVYFQIKLILQSWVH